MSYLIDGSLDPVIQLPDRLTGAVFGPNVSRTYVGTRAGLVAKIVELNLDQRGVRYQLESVGESPLWHLVLDLTQNESTEDPGSPTYDIEAPINIAWRLTQEMAEIDYRKQGRYQEPMQNDLTSEERKQLNAHLEKLLVGTPTTTPSFVIEITKFAEMNERFERGKATGEVYHPVLTRDAAFRPGANYRSKIDKINALYTSAEIIALYPGEIPAQFQERMPTNGYWKVTRNEWEIEASGQGQETIMFTWDEWQDPIDALEMTMPSS